MKTGEWFVKNSIKKNEIYVTILLNKYGFIVGTNCTITADAYGGYGISLSNYLGKSYRIEVDAESRSYKLFGKNTVGGIKEKHRYHLVKSFYGDTAIEDILKFIKSSGTNYRIAC